MKGGNITFFFKGDQSDLDKTASEVSSKMVGLGKTVGSAFVKGTAVVGTALSAVVGLSVKAYADIEQSIGGVQTLFKDSADTVIANANRAFETAGMSANTYMETVTSFSASLLQSLSGDTKKAGDYADRAIVDMSDNANKMGSDMQMIQNAYQGFAKQNYTMLDNLKLGYGGTKEEMQRLIDDANKLKKANGETANLSIKSFADITEAIHVVQNEMGITGTTAKEASTTIEGSLNSAKAAWGNLLAGMADDTSDWQGLIDNFVNTAGVAAQNIIPRIEIALDGVFDLIIKMADQVINFLPGIMQNIIDIVSMLITGIVNTLPNLISAIIGVFPQIISMISWQVPTILTALMNGLLQILQAFTDQLPLILNTGVQLILTFANGLIQSIPTLIPIIFTAVQTIVDTFINNLPMIINTAIQLVMTLVNALLDNIDKLIMAGIDLIIALAFGLIDAIPKLLERLPEIIVRIVDELTKPEMIVKIITAAIQLMIALGAGLIEAIPLIIMSIPEIILGILGGFKDAIFNTDWGQLGKNILEGILQGFSKAGDIIWNAIKRVGNSMIDGIKNFFGIHSPSKVMADQVGKFLPSGIGVGITANTDSALNSIDTMNNQIMDQMKKTVNTEMAGSLFNGMFDLSPQLYGTSSATLSPNINVTVNSNYQQDPLGQMVNSIKTYSGGSKNDGSYGYGGVQ